LKEKERGPLLLSEYMVELIYVLCISIQKERKIKAYLDVRGGLWRVWRVVGAEAERETIWDRDRAGQNRIISSSVATEMILLLFDWDFHLSSSNWACWASMGLCFCTKAGLLA
jgi:hypothetical protein